jgi:hypothetical protein
VRDLSVSRGRGLGREDVDCADGGERRGRFGGEGRGEGARRLGGGEGGMGREGLVGDGSAGRVVGVLVVSWAGLVAGLHWG